MCNTGSARQTGQTRDEEYAGRDHTKNHTKRHTRKVSLVKEGPNGPIHGRARHPTKTTTEEAKKNQLAEAKTATLNDRAEIYRNNRYCHLPTQQAYTTETEKQICESGRRIFCFLLYLCPSANAHASFGHGLHEGTRKATGIRMFPWMCLYVLSASNT